MHTHTNTHTHTHILLKSASRATSLPAALFAPLHSCFTHALLMLYSCFTHDLLMLYSALGLALSSGGIVWATSVCTPHTDVAQTYMCPHTPLSSYCYIHVLILLYPCASCAHFCQHIVRLFSHHLARTHARTHARIMHARIHADDPQVMAFVCVYFGVF